MPSRDVTIIDYGIGNLRSMEKALESVGARVVRTDSPDVLDRSERAVLPGVGAFGACASEIRRRGLIEPIRAFAASGRPLLGVCIGMQLLFERSNEQGDHEGLGLLPGSVTRFDFGSNGASAERLKIPHMGWNAVAWTREDRLLEGLDAVPYFYFVHSYHARPAIGSDTLGTSTYGHPFAAVVGRGNVYGVQFHPEKSQRNGLQILKNFAEMAEGGDPGAEEDELRSASRASLEPVVAREAS